MFLWSRLRGSTNGNFGPRPATVHAKTHTYTHIYTYIALFRQRSSVSSQLVTASYPRAKLLYVDGTYLSMTYSFTVQTERKIPPMRQNYITRERMARSLSVFPQFPQIFITFHVVFHIFDIWTGAVFLWRVPDITVKKNNFSDKFNRDSLSSPQNKIPIKASRFICSYYFVEFFANVLIRSVTLRPRFISNSRVYNWIIHWREFSNLFPIFFFCTFKIRKCLGGELNEIEIFLRREDDCGPFAMERYEEEAEDSDNETDPEQLLNEWLGELDSLTVVSLCLSSALFCPRWTFYGQEPTVVNSVLIARRFVKSL